MNAPPMIARTAPRSGIAVIWVLIIFTVLAATSAAAAWQFSTGRRTRERRQNRVQALWLARAGGELAAARLLSEPDGYTGETVAPIAESKVRITVEKDATQADTFKVRCEAQYPEDGPGSVSIALSWTATRKADPAAVRLEVVDPVATDSQPGP
jgi:type II secretory pathway pseudopilin PulG